MMCGLMLRLYGCCVVEVLAVKRGCLLATMARLSWGQTWPDTGPGNNIISESASAQIQADNDTVQDGVNNLDRYCCVVLKDVIFTTINFTKIFFAINDSSLYHPKVTIGAVAMGRKQSSGACSCRIRSTLVREFLAEFLGLSSLYSWLSILYSYVL